MNNEVVSYCAWDIYINGKSLSLTKRECITDISIDLQCDGSDSCTIKLKDPNFIYIQDNIYVIDVPISVYLSWSNSEKITFEGYISAIDISFTESGFPEMSLFCLDKTHLMNLKEKTRTWDNTTSANVIKKIAKEYGFKCKIEKGYKFKTLETISQSNQTDIAFCESLAKEEEDLFMCKVLGNTLYYVKKGILKKPVAEFVYKDYPHDIKSFNPQINKSTKRVEISNSNISANTKTTETVKVTVDDVKQDVTQGTPVTPKETPATPKSNGIKAHTSNVLTLVSSK